MCIRDRSIQSVLRTALVRTQHLLYQAGDLYKGLIDLEDVAGTAHCAVRTTAAAAAYQRTDLLHQLTGMNAIFHCALTAACSDGSLAVQSGGEYCYDAGIGITEPVGDLTQNIRLDAVEACINQLYSCLLYTSLSVVR